MLYIYICLNTPLLFVAEWFHCRDIPYFVYSFISWWHLGCFCFLALWTVLLWTLMNIIICGHTFSFLLDIYLGVVFTESYSNSVFKLFINLGKFSSIICSYVLYAPFLLSFPLGLPKRMCINNLGFNQNEKFFPQGYHQENDKHCFPRWMHHLAFSQQYMQVPISLHPHLHYLLSHAASNAYPPPHPLAPSTQSLFSARISIPNYFTR